MSKIDSERAAEAVARLSYGRLVALLSRRSRDIMAAEDALSEAFAAALRTWPARGVPNSPEAWLLTAARRNLGHRERAAKVREHHRYTVAQLQETLAGHDAHAEDFPDDRLMLLFVCAHPAIDPAARTPLMLQTVLGLDAARIASAFLVSPATMGQRLVRAKARIRDAGIAYTVPEGDALRERLEDVLGAIYAAYGAGWEALADGEMDMGRVQGLAEEAIWLGQVLVRLLPEPEVLGLLALMCYCESRRAARRDDAGRFVPLSQQDTTRWSGPLISDAEALLTRAARAGRPGRYQCEAAIQSVHCEMAMSGTPRWHALAQLYDALLTYTDAVGVRVGRAAVLLEAHGAPAAVQALEALSAKSVDTYQPYWVTYAHALRAGERSDDADRALRRAVGLTQDPAVREWLLALAHGNGNHARA
ncbi:MAG: DUF6596 domain-containing protein [Pseudomonadota bacterium]